MAYSFQTFSIGQIFTAGQANAIEANIRDHQHGVAGVSSSGMVFIAPVLGAATCTTLNGFTPDEAVALSTKAPKASPVFTTQITTPKVITASGNLEIAPVGLISIPNAAVSHGMTDYIPTDAYGAFQIDNATNGGLRVWGAGDTAGQRGLTLLGVFGDANPTDTVGAIVLGGGKKNGASIQALGSDETILIIDNWGTRLTTVLGSGRTGFCGVISPTAAIHLQASAAGDPSTGPLKFSLAGTNLLVIPEAGVLEPDSSGNLYSTNSSGVRKRVAVTDSTGATLDSGIVTSSLTTVGVLGAGTVPLARMMRTEETKTDTTTLTFTSINVEVGDRILLTGSLRGSTATILTWDKASGTASCNFGGDPAGLTQVGTGSSLCCSGVCSVVTTPGTLVLRLTPSGTGTLNTYGHILVLRGI